MAPAARRQDQVFTSSVRQHSLRLAGRADHFPDLAHDDEVDACSGALEILNPPMQSWAAYEIMREQAEETRAAQQRKPQPAPPNPARVYGMVRLAGKTENSS
jgi:hypothetical protein